MKKVPLKRCVVGLSPSDDQVVLRLPEHNEICQYAPGRPLTLSVDCGAPAPSFVPRLSSPVSAWCQKHQEELGEAVDLLEVWPSSVAARLICLDLAVIEGNTVFDNES